MDIRKLSLVIPAIMFMSSGAFADERGQQAPRHYQQQQPEPQYDEDDCGGGGCGQAIPPGYGCGGGCGQFNPGINYYCGPQCPPPVLPYPQPIVPYPLYPPPVVVAPPIYNGPIYGGPAYGGPGYGGPGYGGGRPSGWGPGGPGYGRNPMNGAPMYGGRPNYGYGGGARPMPYRRMSATVGCSVKDGSVFSAEGREIFKADISSHAQENAEYMKSYYENSATGLCGAVKASDKALDI